MKRKVCEPFQRGHWYPEGDECPRIFKLDSTTFYTPFSEENKKILEELGIEEIWGYDAEKWFVVSLSGLVYFESSYTDRHQIVITIIESENLRQYLICNLL